MSLEDTLRSIIESNRREYIDTDNFVRITKRRKLLDKSLEGTFSYTVDKRKINKVIEHERRAVKREGEVEIKKQKL